MCKQPEEQRIGFEGCGTKPSDGVTSLQDEILNELIVEIFLFCIRVMAGIVLGNNGFRNAHWAR